MPAPRGAYSPMLLPQDNDAVPVYTQELLTEEQSNINFSSEERMRSSSDFVLLPHYDSKIKRTKEVKGRTI